MNDESDEIHNLAVLAALLNPGLCQTNPDEAIDAAVELLDAVSARVTARKLMEKRMQEWIETGADEEDKKPVPLNEVIDYVTEEREKKHPHIGRAEEAFTKF